MKISDDLINAGFIFREVNPEKMDENEIKKYELAKQICMNEPEIKPENADI